MNFTSDKDGDYIIFAVTSADFLAGNRYADYGTAYLLRNSTSMTGKWHLDKQPTDFGFQRYFGHLSGACNFYRGDRSFRHHPAGRPNVRVRKWT